MKSLRVVLALAFIVALIAACSAGHGNGLTGKWQKEDGSGTIEFTKDGKMNLSGCPATIISAAFKVKDKEILADLGIFGTGTLKYAIDKDALTLTDAKGNAVKYAKVKETKAPEAPKAQVEAPKAKVEPPKAQAEAPKAKVEPPKAKPEAAKAPAETPAKK